MLIVEESRNPLTLSKGQKKITKKGSKNKAQEEFESTSKTNSTYMIHPGSPPKKNGFGQFFNRILRKSSKPGKTQSCPLTETQKTGSDLAKEYFIVNKQEIPISVSRSEMNVGDMIRNWLEEPNPFQRISNSNSSKSGITGKRTQSHDLGASFNCRSGKDRKNSNEKNKNIRDYDKIFRNPSVNKVHNENTLQVKISDQQKPNALSDIEGPFSRSGQNSPNCQNFGKNVVDPFRLSREVFPEFDVRSKIQNEDTADENFKAENQQEKPGDVNKFIIQDKKANQGILEEPESPENYIKQQIVNPNEVNKWIVSIKELKSMELFDSGSYGQVFKGKWCETDVAIKKMFPPNDCNGYFDLNPQELKDFQEEFSREIQIMMSLRHVNIVLFCGVVLEPEKCIIQEFVKYGSIYNLLHRQGNLKNLKIQEHIKNSLIRRLEMALQVARGVNYLHYKKILHLDLKTQNLLVGEGFKVKVCDFGLSRIKVLRTYKSKGTFGTPEYMAPEVLREGEKSEKADIFSFGVVLYELVTLLRPWEKIAPEIVWAQVALYNKKLEIPEDVDERIKYLILRCWEDNPAKRPTFVEIIGELEEVINEKIKKPQITQQQNLTRESSQP